MPLENAYNYVRLRVKGLIIITVACFNIKLCEKQQGCYTLSFVENNIVVNFVNVAFLNLKKIVCKLLLYLDQFFSAFYLDSCFLFH